MLPALRGVSETLKDLSSIRLGGPWMAATRALLTPAARVTAVVLVALIHVAFVYWATHETLPDRVFDLRRAERAAAGAASGWTNRSLPDLERRPDLAGEEVWYRLNFSLADISSQPLAVYLRSSSAPPTVLVNGVRLNALGETPRRVPRFWDQPSLYVVTEAALLEAGSGPLMPGRSELLVRIRADDAGRLAMGTAAVGYLTDLEPVYRRARLARVTAPRLIAFSMLLSGLLFFLLWRRRRSDAVYIHFVIAMVLWAAHTLTYVIENPPLPTRLWEWVRLTSLLWLALSVTGFTLSYLGRPNPQLARGQRLGGVAATALLAVLAATPWYFPVADYVWPGLCLAVSLTPLGALRRTARGWPGIETAWLGAGGAMILVLTAHDVLVLGGWWPGEETLVLAYAAPVTIVAFVSILLTRFARALQTAETLNLELESRVAEREGQLRLSYDRLRAVEREQDLVSERERIMRDMHDGVGGHLVSLLAGLENEATRPEALAARLREALEDLRLMIHSLDNADEDLDVALATVRPKLESVLAAGGIALDWKVAGTGEGVRLGPGAVLQLMRILQEAVTNALKHSGADRVTVTLERTADAAGPAACLSVHDNGRGLAARRPTGRGLDNIRHRALTAGGRADIRREKTGTVVEVLISLPAAGPADLTS